MLKSEKKVNSSQQALQEENSKKRGLMQLCKGNKKLLFILYALFFLGWLFKAVFLFASDNAMPEIVLNPKKAVLNQLSLVNENEYEILGGDPQFVFEGLNVKARRLVLRANFAKPPDEMDLYYSKKRGQGFAEKKRVWAQPKGKGVYVYELPKSNFYALRLDMGSSGTSRVVVQKIVLNEAALASEYFVPNLRTVCAFILLPLLAYCCICIIMEAVVLVFLKQEIANE